MTAALQTSAVGVAIDALEVLDAVDITARLRELDALSLLQPGVDVVLPRVVGGEREALVSVLVEEVSQVPGAVADVDLRVVEVADAETGAAGVNGDPLRGRGQELHQPDRTRARARIGPELALLVDDSGEQGRVEVVVLGVPADDLLVPE